MRCKACNVNLSDRESTRKFLELDEYVDLCDECLSTTDINVWEEDVEEDGDIDKMV